MILFAQFLERIYDALIAQGSQRIGEVAVRQMQEKLKTS